MDAKFTQGPLVTRRINDTAKPFAVINPKGRHGDEIVAGYLTEADAALYAAAPALYSAALGYLNLLKSDYEMSNGQISAQMRAEYDGVRAALSAALGDQP